MSFRQTVTIEGLQELQAANAKMIAALKPTGAMGKVVQHVTAAFHRYAISITHVDTGALRASERMTVEFGGSARGVVFVDGNNRNPHGMLVDDYAGIEEARGGSHGYFGRTVRERGPSALKEAGQIIISAMPKGS